MTTLSVMQILVTGANRGIGLEFTKNYLTQGHHLFAVTRANLDSEQGASLRALKEQFGDKLSVLLADVTSEADVRSVAESLHASCLDVLVNNAGVIGKLTSFEEIDFDDVQRVFDVNVVGPLRLTRALLPMLRQSKAPKVAHLSSLMGSVADNRSGGAFAYRISKAALNMASKNLAISLAESHVISVVLHPGWVQTDMGGPNATLDVRTSVTGMMDVLDKLSLADSGKFFDYRGKELPW